MAALCGWPRTGCPAGRTGLSRDKCFWPSTRWGCSRTGPEVAAVLLRSRRSRACGDRLFVDVLAVDVDERHLQPRGVRVEHAEAVRGAREDAALVGAQRIEAGAAAAGDVEAHAVLRLERLHVVIVAADVNVRAVAQQRQQAFDQVR